MSRNQRLPPPPPTPPSPPPEEESDFDDIPPPSDFDDESLPLPPDEEDDDAPPPPDIDEEEFDDVENIDESDLPDIDEEPFPDDEEDFEEDIEDEDFPIDDDEFPEDDIEEDEEDLPPPSDTLDDLSIEEVSVQQEVLKPGTRQVPVNNITSTNKSSGKNVMVEFNLNELTAGLIVKDPPKFFNRNSNDSSKPTSNINSASIEEKESKETISTNVSAEKTVTGLSESQLNEIIKEKGFISAFGRFDGDLFESLFVRIEKANKKLYVMIPTGQEMDFDLSRKAYVFEDVADPNTIILDYHKNIIIFKFESSEALINFMKHMPDEVFMAPDLTKEEETKIKEKEKEDSKKKSKAPLKPIPTTTPKFEHAKGTSVEDILESDFDQAANVNQLFQVRDHAPTLPPTPQRRKELVDTHIRRARYSVRRVTLVCEWINSLKIWPNKLSITSLHKEMCNGVLLANIVKKLNPEVQFVHLNEKALAKKPAMDNLEQALGHIWRSKSLNNSRIPTAIDIYSGNTSKTAILLNELFTVYVQKPLYKNVLKMLKWYQYILKQYNKPLPQYVFDEGDLSAIWPHFQNGTALFCILFHFYGSVSIGSGPTAQRVDPLRISGDPTSISSFRENLTYVFSLLYKLNIEVLWSPEDWITNPDTEFLILQLSNIYEAFKYKQCTLPPAQGDKPGLTSGPNGEAIVAGLVFCDAPIHSKFLPKTRKAVRLGHDKDSMPLLPIDQASISKNMMHGILPLGMISNNAKVAQIALELKESKIHAQRNDWNGRTTVHTEKENYAGHHLVSLLREHHKRGEFAESKDSPEKSFPLTKANFNSNAKSSEDIAKDINDMIKALETEMTSAQQKMSQYEEELANKYITLEEKATSIAIEQYESELQELENERVELENEKQRLQDHFARKLALIRERKDEAHQKNFALQQAHFAEIASSTQSIKPQTMKEDSPSKSKQSLKKSVSFNPSKNPALAEKGWIKLSAKMDTHNYHLKNKQTVSSAAFQAKITPKKWREKEQQLKTEPKSTIIDSSINLGSKSQLDISFSNNTTGYPNPNDYLSLEELIQDSFSRFKLRLQSASIKWIQSKQQKNRSKLHDILNSEPKQAKVELISLPEKSFALSGFNISPELYQTIQNLRSEELNSMFYEDERRKMVLAEESLEHSLNISKQLFNYSAAVNSPIKTEETIFSENFLSQAPVLFNQPQADPMVETIDLNSAINFLITPRTLIINDRSPKQFVFVLCNISNITTQENSFASVREKNSLPQYVIEWRDPNPFTQVETVAGFVLLTDISSLEVYSQNQTNVSLVIRESPKALKNSKGRTQMVLSFADPYDALTFIQSIICIQHEIYNYDM